MNKRKLLIITSRFPYPVIGGDRLRIFQICKVLSQVYSLNLVTLCENKSEMLMLMPEDGVFSSIERFYLPKWRSWLNCFFALFGSRPLQVAYYNDKSFIKRVLALMPHYDATMAHLIRTADIVKFAPGIKFLEMTDAISLNYNRVQETKSLGNDFRTLIYQIEAKRVNKYEQTIAQYFNLSFLVSNIDRMYLFAKRPELIDYVHVVSNGVDLTSLPYQFSYQAKDIIFIGNMSSLQNLDAAIYMASEILPLIRERMPEVSLRLIGRIASRDAEALSNYNGVWVSGEVDDISLIARGGAVGVCPLRLGAGVQNKVLEYMALGLPTVTTSMGLEGFRAEPDFHVLVADDAKTFAEKVLFLLLARENAEIMALKARDFVKNEHSWQYILNPMLKSMNEIIEKVGVDLP